MSGPHVVERLIRNLPIAALLLATVSTAPAAERAGWPLRLARPYDYGVFRNDSAAGMDPERLRTEVVDPIIQTSYVPAREGVLFGIRYSVLQPPDPAGMKVPVSLMYVTPGIEDTTTGRLRHRIEIDDFVDLERPTHVMAFKFADPGELVPGPWHFYVFQGDVLVVSHTFVVIP